LTVEKNVKKLRNSDLIPLENSKLFDSILESFYDGIYITDGEGVTLYVNSAYERISGFTKEEVMGKNIKGLIKKGMFSQSSVHKVLETKKVASVIHHYVTGEKALATGTPIYDLEGNIVRVVCNVRDISDLLKLRKELQESKELTSKFSLEIQELIQQQKKELGNIVVRSSKMEKVFELAARAAHFDSTVLLFGESGVGKEIVAKFLYSKSFRNNKPFIKINCAAVPSSLIESELFGYEKGSFTGARSEGKPGCFELADGGTILLDEVGEIPLDIQPKLLRVIQEGEITPIGSTQQKKIDVRIISATNKDLKEEVKNGKFREDLFFRLNVVPIYLPPLRERKEEIAPLIYNFLKRINQKYSTQKTISSEVIEALTSYNWPGNVRELENLVEYLFVISGNEEIILSHLPANIKEDFYLGSEIRANSLQDIIESVEKKVILTSLKNHTSLRKAAKKLGISPATLSRKAKKHRIAVTNMQKRYDNETE
jgi:PAS domain S-box-containing protein